MEKEEKVIGCMENCPNYKRLGFMDLFIMRAISLLGVLYLMCIVTKDFCNVYLSQIIIFAISMVIVLFILHILKPGSDDSWEGIKKKERKE